MKINSLQNHYNNRSFGMAKLTYPLKILIQDAGINAKTLRDEEELRQIKKTLSSSLPDMTVHSELHIPSFLEKFFNKNAKPNEIIYIDDEYMEHISFDKIPTSIERLKAVANVVEKYEKDFFDGKYY